MSTPETSGGVRALLTGANIVGAAAASFLVFGPISVATAARAWLVVAFALVYVLRVLVTTYVTVQRPDTRRLKAHYGDEFDRWAAKTRRYVPLVW